MHKLDGDEWKNSPVFGVRNWKAGQKLQDTLLQNAKAKKMKFIFYTYLDNVRQLFVDVENHYRRRRSHEGRTSTT